MLVLNRKLQQSIRIGDTVTITILRIRGKSVRIGIEAPEDLKIVRGELGDFRVLEQPRERPGERAMPSGRGAEGRVVAERPEVDPLGAEGEEDQVPLGFTDYPWIGCESFDPTLNRPR